MSPHLLSKPQSLRANGTLNLHPNKITDSLFANADFFDARDLL
jgi:hypothetical protein